MMDGDLANGTMRGAWNTTGKEEAEFHPSPKLFKCSNGQPKHPMNPKSLDGLWMGPGENL